MGPFNPNLETYYGVPGAVPSVSQAPSSSAPSNYGGSSAGAAVAGAFNLISQGIQNAYNRKMWDKQNEYNSPAAQMQRLKDAGLNTNLMYGNGASATVTGNADAPPKFVDNNLDAVSLWSAIQQQKLMNAQIRSIELDNQVAEQNAAFDRELFPLIKAAQSKDLTLTDRKIADLEASTSKLIQDAQDNHEINLKQFDILVEEAKQAKFITENQKTEFDATISSLKANTSECYKNIEKANKQIELLNQQIAEAKQNNQTTKTLDRYKIRHERYKAYNEKRLEYYKKQYIKAVEDFSSAQKDWNPFHDIERTINMWEARKAYKAASGSYSSDDIPLPFKLK